MAAGKRLDGEKFDDYRKRLKIEKIIMKNRIKGTLFWDSKKYGTYIKENI